MDTASGVMSRMDWLNELKGIFNRIAVNNSQLSTVAQATVSTNHLIFEIKTSTFRLETPQTYYSTCRDQALSLGEVWTAFSQWKTPQITWDQVLDTLVQSSIANRLETAVPSHSESLAVDEESETLEVAFPTPKLHCAPEAMFTDRLRFLSLAGNSLQHTNWSFPRSLVVLNLAANQLTEVVFDRPLASLKLLNVTNNRITRVRTVPKFKGLRELYIGYNSLTHLNFFSLLEQLRVLDACYNEVSSSEAMGGLVKLDHLVALRVKGNPVSRQTDALKQFALLTQCQVDPVNLLGCSEFSGDYLPFVPLVRPPRLNHSLSKGSIPTSPKASSPVGTDSARSVRWPKPTPIKTQSTLPLNFAPDLDCSDMKDSARSPKSGVIRERRSVVVTKELIHQLNNKAYDNPVKAVMISPARSPQSFVQKKRSVSVKPKPPAGSKKVVKISLGRRS